MASFRIFNFLGSGVWLTLQCNPRIAGKMIYLEKRFAPMTEFEQKFDPHDNINSIQPFYCRFNSSKRWPNVEYAYKLYTKERSNKYIYIYRQLFYNKERFWPMLLRLQEP